MTTQIPDLGPWGTLSDIIEGGINEATAKAEEALSRSGTSVTEPTPGVVRLANSTAGQLKHALGVSPAGALPSFVAEQVAAAIALPTPSERAAMQATLDQFQAGRDVDDVAMASVAATDGTAFLSALTRNGKRPVGRDEQVIDVMHYGAVADGVADDTAALNAAANAARAGRTGGRQGHAVLLPADRNVYINGTVDLRYIIDVRLDGKVIVGPNGLLILGHSAGQRPGQRIRLWNVLHAAGGQTNVCARFVGLKQAEVTIGSCSSVELLADNTGTVQEKAANNSVAYNTFTMGWISTLHLRGVGDAAWVNQNTFIGGTYGTIRLSGDYSHNENTWVKPCLEGGMIDVQRGERNRWMEARCEAGTRMTFGPLTLRNVIEDSYVSNLNTRESGATIISDLGVENAVIGVPDLTLHPASLARLDAGTLAFGAGACEYAGDGITPGLDRVKARANFHFILDTGVVPLHEDVAALPSSERYAAGWRVRRFEISSDVVFWRPYLTLYDANGAVVTRDGISGAWAYTTQSGWEEAFLGGDTRHTRFTVMSQTATHIRIRVRAMTQAPFRWLQLNAFSPMPSSPSGLDVYRRAIRRPLYQASAPTQGLAHPGTVVQGPTGSWRSVARVDTTVSADAASGATTVTVATAAGMAAGDVIGVVLSTGLTHWTTIASIAGTTVTLAAALPASAAAGAKVGTTRWA